MRVMCGRLVLRANFVEKDCGFRTMINVVEDTRVFLIATNKDMLG